MIAVLCGTVLLLNPLALSQATTAPARATPADGKVGLTLHVPQSSPHAYQPYSLVVELENHTREPIRIDRPIAAMSASYRAQVREGTANHDYYRLLVYFEPPKGVPHDVDRHEMLRKIVVTIEPDKSCLFRVEIPFAVLAPGDNRLTAVLHHDGADLAESRPLTLHCELPATAPSR
jgi:hypothetical protein